MNRFKVVKPLSSYSQDVQEFSFLHFFDIDCPFESLVINDSDEYEFLFLNLRKKFNRDIDWNFSEYGKLWNYNLQYLDYLKQSSIPTAKKFELIESLYQNLLSGNLKLEPYPASLRIMNMIRFVSTEKLTKHQIEKTNQYIQAETAYLNQNLEYHILANHLLENLFAMHMSAVYFKNEQQQFRFQRLLIEQLNEQILEDGAHYELSPMYHKIILFRVLELYYYIKKNINFSNYIKEKLSAMLSWLNEISFSDGRAPHLNDSTEGIIYSNKFFFKTAEKFEITVPAINLKNSGYRKFEKNGFEMVLDVNGISPSYQPGHAHADTFSFCLNYESKPIVVDVGISTYNISARRNWERSTEAHNTVSINNENSAEVWSGFRVGRRLDVNVLKDEKDHITAQHNGYKRFGVLVERNISFDDDIHIVDNCIGRKKNFASLNLHFHPDVVIQQNESSITVNNEIKIHFSSTNLMVSEYDFCIGYNLFKKAKKVQINFLATKLITRIQKL